jgi:predicted nucleic acid-binding protein
LASKLREKFDWNEDRIRAAFKTTSRTAQVVKTRAHLTIVRDAADNRILECAEHVDADLIVTGDPHLLKLRRFGDFGGSGACQVVKPVVKGRISASRFLQASPVKFAHADDRTPSA